MKIYYVILNSHVVDPEFKKSHFANNVLERSSENYLILNEAHHVFISLNGWLV